MGKTVLCDRFTDSSEDQGGGRKLGAGMSLSFTVFSAEE